MFVKSIGHSVYTGVCKYTLAVPCLIKAVSIDARDIITIAFPQTLPQCHYACCCVRLLSSYLSVKCLFPVLRQLTSVPRYDVHSVTQIIFEPHHQPSFCVSFISFARWQHFCLGAKSCIFRMFCAHEYSTNLRYNEKMRKEIERLKKKLEEEARRSNKYKKRYQRERARQSGKNGPPTPRTKTRNLLRSLTTKQTKRELLFHTLLVQQVRAKYASTKKERLKRLWCRLFSSSVIKKYRMKKYFQDKLGFSARRWTPANKTEHVKKKSKSIKFGDCIRQFYTRDDNSRMTTGRKDTKTRRKSKMQRCVLTSSLQDLHAKFCLEQPKMKIGYSLFCRMRPFWVTFPTARDRDTCACKLHENISLMARKLRDLALIKTDDLRVLTAEVVCDASAKSCMYGDCDDCKDLRVPFEVIEDHNSAITWSQWKTVKEERQIGGENRTVSLTKKVNVNGTAGELVSRFETALDRFKSTPSI